MDRTLSRRLTALFLAFAFAGGVFGLPALDALIYHSGHQSLVAEGPHFDEPGGCGSHAEHCALALSGALGQLASVATSSARIVRTATVEPAAAPSIIPHAVYRTPLPPSRAPPSAAS